MRVDPDGRFRNEEKSRMCWLANVCIGDAAVTLLKAGAETDKKDVNGHSALDLAPDKEASPFHGE